MSRKNKCRTIRFIKDGKSGELIDINALEYATIIFDYAASCCYWLSKGNCKKYNIPHPMMRCYADNIPAKIWTNKGCKRSMTGRRLGRLQCALVIGNPVGFSADRIDTKSNEIADAISRWKSETDTLLGVPSLLQKFPQLKCCRRFHPAPELISLVMDALSSESLVDPTTVSQLVQKNPGRIVL